MFCQNFFFVLDRRHGKLAALMSLAITRFLPTIDPRVIPAVALSTIVSVALPVIAKTVHRTDQRWVWAAAVGAVVVSFAIFHKYAQTSVRISSFAACGLSAMGVALAHLLLDRKAITRNPLATAFDVLDQLLPNGGEQILYTFYIATERGFSLILSKEIPQMRFTHGCDPIGGLIDPMITDVSWRRVPKEFLDRLPETTCVQGVWKQPGRYAPSISLFLDLIQQRKASLDYSTFTLQVAENQWKPMPQNPHLKGMSFPHHGDSTVVWMHEPNSDAYGSALKQARAEQARLETAIAIEAKLIENCNKVPLDRLSSKLPSAAKHPHSGLQIEMFKNPVRSEIPPVSLVTTIRDNATQYKLTLEQRLEVVKARIGRLEKREEMPTSVQLPTVQVKMTAPLSETAVLHLHRQVAREVIGVLKMIQYRRLLQPLETHSSSQSFYNQGKELLLREARSIAENRDSETVIDFDRFRQEVEHHRDVSWENLEWMLNRFAQFHANFAMSKSFPFLRDEREWFGLVATHLLGLLYGSGRMTIDLEMELKPLSQQLELLQKAEPLYLIKRLTQSGHFICAVSNRSNDPIASLDEVHIPI